MTHSLHLSSRIFLVSLLLLILGASLSSGRAVQHLSDIGLQSRRYDFHQELARLEARALERLPWKTSSLAHDIETRGNGTLTGSELWARADAGEAGMGDMILSLWRNAPDKVPVNNIFVAKQLDPGQDIVITTPTCYGCTVVALCSGTMCILAHFRQINGNTDSWVAGADAAFVTNVMGPVDDALSEYKSQLGTSPLAIIFTPSATSGSFIYASRVEGDDSIGQAVLNEYPQAQLLNIGYSHARAKGDFGDDTPWGKLVLEWRGGGSNCAVGAAISTLNVFAETSWYLRLTFDEAGNPVTIDKTPCDSPSGSNDVFDEPETS